MTFFRSIIRINKFRVVYNKNCCNGEKYFVSKVEVPSPPKRPLTAYMIFCKENRNIVLKENPSLSSPEQIKMLAKKWSHLTRDMKEPYELSARESTLMYGELHKKFYENLTDEQKEELIRLKAEKKESRRLLKLKKALRDSGIPKPATSAYAHFVHLEAKNKPSVKHPSEFIKKAAENWKTLPKDTKMKFEEQAQAEKKRYVIELNNWRSRMLTEGKDHLIKAFEEIKGKGKFLDLENVQPVKKKVTGKQLPKTEASKK